MARGAEGKKVYYILLTIILIYAFAYCYHQATYFVPYPYAVTGEDATYSFLAREFLNGTFRESSFVFSLRILQILPTAFFTLIFGSSYYSASAWNIATFFGSIVVVFYLGKELYDERAGLIAALLLTFFPVAALLSYTSNAEGPLIFFSAASALALLRSKKSGSKAWGFLSGLLLFAASLAATLGFVLVIIGAAYLIFDQAFNKEKIPTTVKASIICGAFATLLFSALFNYLYSGNPLMTITGANSFYGSAGCGVNQTTNSAVLQLYSRFSVVVGCNNLPLSQVTSSPTFYLSTIFPYTIYDLSHPLSLIYARNHVGPFFYAAFPAIAYLLLRKRRSASIVNFWFVSGFLYLSLGPTHISVVPFRYLLLPESWFYLAIIAVPVVLSISIALADLLKKHRSSRAVCIFVLLVVAALALGSILSDANVFIGFG